MTYRLLTVVWVSVGFLAAGRADEPPPLWIAVVAPEFGEALSPLEALRRQQGYEVVVLKTTDVLTPAQIQAGEGEPLRERVRGLWGERQAGACVLLVGAPFPPTEAAPASTQPAGTPPANTRPSGPPPPERSAARSASAGDRPPAGVVPALRGSVARMKGEPTDNGYGCVEGELVARVAVGRLPARSVAEAEVMVRKTIAWEAPPAGPWKRQFLLLAGAPSYNPDLDALVERLALARLAEVDPFWFGRAIYYNPTSVFCPPDAELLPLARAYLESGPAVTVFLGHSHAAGFWGTRVGGAYTVQFTREEWGRLVVGNGGGLLASFGCNGAQLSGRDGEGYGLYAVRNPRGPVAVIGSHGVCWANMSMLCSDALMGYLPSARRSLRLGELWLAMKRHLAEGEISPIVYHALDAVDGDPHTPPDVQRREHQEMFLLLGDPALRLPAAGHEIPLRLTTREGGRVAVSGTVPEALAGASGHARLERAPVSPPRGVQPLTPELSPEEAAARRLANFHQANAFILQEAPLTLDGREFSAELTLPEAAAREQLLVRVYLVKGAVEGMGVRTVRR